MSDIDVSFRYEAMNDGSIAAVVQNRIYAVDLEQGTQLPALTYQRIDSPRKVYEHGQGSSFPFARYQIGCWSGTLSGAMALAAVVCAAFNGKAGTWGTGADAVEVQNCQVADERDYKDASAVLYCRQVDLRIFFKE